MVIKLAQVEGFRSSIVCYSWNCVLIYIYPLLALHFIIYI